MAIVPLHSKCEITSKEKNKMMNKKSERKRNFLHLFFKVVILSSPRSSSENINLISDAYPAGYISRYLA